MHMPDTMACTRQTLRHEHAIFHPLFLPLHPPFPFLSENAIMDMEAGASGCLSPDLPGAHAEEEKDGRMMLL
jgi:hypothetical protein